MSLTCSVLGHRYGQTEVEREREEEGSEVIITVREVTRCDRCGNERIVSENKEVTTLETAAEIVADDLEAEEAAESPDETAEQTETASEEPQPASEQPTVDVAEAEEHLETSGVSGVHDDSMTDDVIEAGEDDAVILDDDDDEDEIERKPGQWPEEAEAQAAESADGETDSWPEEDEAEVSGNAQSAEWPEETLPETTDDHREPGEWPQEPEPEDDGSKWESLTKPEPRPLDEPAVEPTKSAVSVPDGIFRCSECEYSTPVEQSPLRAGDFCPECRIGSLEHHTE